MLWFVNSNRSIQKIVFTPFIHCYYLLSCFVISLEIKFDVFCVNSESGGVCVFRLAKIPSNAPLVFKNGWKIILMTESCWEWYKVHFYTKTLDINIMLTFSTQKIRFCMKLHKKKNCMIVYHPENTNAFACYRFIDNTKNLRRAAALSVVVPPCARLATRHPFFFVKYHLQPSRTIKIEYPSQYI